MFSLAIVLSPAVLFDIERANIDSVIFLLLVSAVLMFSNHSKYQLHLIGISLIFIAAAFKYFPIAALALIPLSLEKEKKPILISVLTFLFFLGYLYLNGDTVLMQWNDPSIRFTSVSFGRNIIPDFFGPRIPYFIAILFSIVTFGIIPIAILFGLKPKSIYLAQPLSLNQKLYITGAFIFLASYLIGNSCDYRLIFLLLLVPYLLEKDIKATYDRLLLFLIVMALWANFFHIQLNLMMYTLPANRMIYLPNVYYIWVDEFINLTLFCILSIKMIPRLTNAIIGDKLRISFK